MPVSRGAWKEHLVTARSARAEYRVLERGVGGQARRGRSFHRWTHGGGASKSLRQDPLGKPEFVSCRRFRPRVARGGPGFSSGFVASHCRASLKRRIIRGKRQPSLAMGA